MNVLNARLRARDGLYTIAIEAGRIDRIDRQPGNVKVGS